MDTGEARAQVLGSVTILRQLPLFAELGERDLVRICGMARRERVGPGTLVIEEGAPGDGLYVIVDGELEVTKREGDEELTLAIRGAGEFIGEMSLLEQGPRTASARALRETELLVIEPTAFQELLFASPSLATGLLRTVTARLRSTEASLMQRERLASLGTLAAGLAHELNNPAAAIQRATTHLREALEEWSAHAVALETLPPSVARSEVLREGAPNRQPGAGAGAGQVPGAATTAGTEAEEAVQNWLEGHDIRNAWAVAPVLAAAGWDEARAEALADRLTPEELPLVIGWLAASLQVGELVRDIEQSARAMSEVVGAVRRYTYLDRGPIQDVDLRDTLESTLVILRHRLKHGVEIVRDYADDVPPIEAYGSELNQVWTNLVANAVDAMEGEGTLELRTRRAGDHAEVEITDSGPGIPPEIADRIFDPFFTTKPPGSGTGLGLHISWGIVVNRHRGRIEVESAPGRTTFRVRLPLRLRRGGEGGLAR